MMPQIYTFFCSVQNAFTSTLSLLILAANLWSRWSYSFSTLKIRTPSFGMIWWLGQVRELGSDRHLSQDICLIPGPVCSLECTKGDSLEGRDDCRCWVLKMVCDHKKPKKCRWAHQLPRAVPLEMRYPVSCLLSACTCVNVTGSLRGHSGTGGEPCWERL